MHDFMAWCLRKQRDKRTFLGFTKLDHKRHSDVDEEQQRYQQHKKKKLEERIERDLLPLTFRYRWKDKQREGGETNVILRLVGTLLKYHSVMMLLRRPWD